MLLKNFVKVFEDDQEFRIVLEDGFVCEEDTKESILKNGLMTYWEVKGVRTKYDIVFIYC